MAIWEKMDKTEYKENSFKLIPEGMYITEVTDVEIKEELFPEGVNINVEFTVLTEAEKGTTVKWRSSLKDDSSEKAIQFVKSQICNMAGVKSTEGRPMEILAECKGNKVLVQISHSPGYKDPSKTFANVFVREKLT